MFHHSRQLAASLFMLGAGANIANADATFLDRLIDTQAVTDVVVTMPTGSDRFLVAGRGKAAGKLNLMAFRITAANKINALGRDRFAKVSEVKLCPRKLRGHFILAVRNSNDRLKLLSIKIQGGVPTVIDRYTAGVASNIAIAPVKDTTTGEFVTAHKNGSGNLVVKCWRIGSLGAFHLKATDSASGGATKGLDLNARHQGSDYVRILTAKRGTLNNLRVFSWSWNVNTDALERVGDANEGTIRAVTMGKRGDRPIVAGRRPGTDYLLLQKWWNSGTGCNDPAGGACFVRPIVLGTDQIHQVNPNANLTAEAWGSDGAIMALRGSGGKLMLWTFKENTIFGDKYYVFDGEDSYVAGRAAKRIALGFSGDNVPGARAVTATRHGDRLHLALWCIHDWAAPACP